MQVQHLTPLLAPRPAARQAEAAQLGAARRERDRDQGRRAHGSRPSSRSPVVTSFATRVAPAVLRWVSSRSPSGDRKSTRLNSSHVAISYAVFCLKKKTHVK